MKEINLKNRSANVLRNLLVSVICQIITIILGFLCRKVLIASLGLDYVGATSLFSSIIGLLSFVELGIGNAITFSLYKPLVDNNKEKISTLVHFYNKIYAIIFIAVLVIGSIAFPFLPQLVHMNEGIKENIYLMYALTLLSTCATYFLAAPKTLLIADQKQFVDKIVYQVCHIFQVILQIIVLFALKNFYLFLILQIISPLANNCVSTIYTYRKYPFLKNKSKSIEKSDKKTLFTDVGSLFTYKIGSSFLNYISNIFISYFCGLLILGKIANYLLILSTLSALITQINSSFSATVGNKSAAEKGKLKNQTFFDSLFVVTWAAGFFLTGYLLFADKFTFFFFGSESLISFDIVLCLGILYFVQDVHSISATYRYSLGFFKKGRFIPIIASFLNVGFSFIFYHLFGICGLYISTILSRIFTLGISDPYIILGGKSGVAQYYRHIIIYCIVLFVLYGLSRKVLSFFPISSFGTLVMFVLLFCVVFNIAWFFIFSKTKEFANISIRLKYLFKKVKFKIQKKGGIDL